jgi:hypothetical protein
VFLRSPVGFYRQESLLCTTAESGAFTAFICIPCQRNMAQVVPLHNSTK